MASESAVERHRVDSLDEQQPLGRHLVLMYRSFEDEMLRKLHENRRFDSISIADHDVLRFIKPTGTTAVEIARLNGVSKQRVGKAIESLQARGFVVRERDPSDGRAFTIRFSKKGYALAEEVLRIVGEIEARYDRILGREEHERLKRSLRALFEGSR